MMEVFNLVFCVVGFVFVLVLVMLGIEALACIVARAHYKARERKAHDRLMKKASALVDAHNKRVADMHKPWRTDR